MSVFLIQVTNLFFQVIIYLILGRAIMSWFIRPGDRLFQLYMAVVRITDPILLPFRNLSGRLMRNSGVDFSPMLAILVLYFLQRVIIGLLISF
ncbi:hypothetical protein MASR2M70_15130 [Bacillota bacterium]